MTDLQMYCVRASSMLPALSPVKLNEYYDVLIKLIEKQSLLYFRFNLMTDNEEAQMLAQMMRDFTYQIAGTDEEGNPRLDESTPLEKVFMDLIERVEKQKQSIAPAVAEQLRLEQETQDD